MWQIDNERNVFTRSNGRAARIAAKQVLIATGAMERPVPVPGWTLPGVMTCGAAQTLLKVQRRRARQAAVVLAGSGPLLLLLAAQLVRAGVKPAAILETRPNYLAALRHLPAISDGARLFRQRPAPADGIARRRRGHSKRRAQSADTRRRAGA